MATMTALKKVGAAVVGIATGVTDTFVNQALEIANAGKDAWGGSLDIPETDVTTVVNYVTENSTWGKYVGSRKENERKILSTRQKEVRDIIAAYNWISPASKVFKGEYGELRREHFMRIAREIPKCPDAESAAMYAVEYFQDRDAKRGKGKNVAPEKALDTHLEKAIDLARKVGNDSLANSLVRLRKNHC